MVDGAILQDMLQRIRKAAAERRPLQIRAGGTKDFYGNTPRGDLFDPRPWNGIVSYEPSELVVTVRAGTSLHELETLLHDQQQMLPFEPPHFGAAATVGGCVASGLAGPRRNTAGYAYGGVRDAVLGATLLDGNARVLKFGGTVLKNVAGYDVSRLLVGSLGILGVILEVSLKVLPRPEREATLRLALSESAAALCLQDWLGRALPISGSCWRRDVLHVRLSGATAAVEKAVGVIGGESLGEVAMQQFWQAQREQTDPWFAGDLPLWRVSVSATAPPLGIAGEQTLEWAGAQRWLRTTEPAASIRARALELDGHCTLFRGGKMSDGVFMPLGKQAAAIHQRLKQDFDPARVMNPGRMYLDL
jgi:glycolate oxidase FAD binding subunit